MPRVLALRESVVLGECTFGKHKSFDKCSSNPAFTFWRVRLRTMITELTESESMGGTQPTITGSLRLLRGLCLSNLLLNLAKASQPFFKAIIPILHIAPSLFIHNIPVWFHARALPSPTTGGGGAPSGSQNPGVKIEQSVKQASRANKNVTIRTVSKMPTLTKAFQISKTDAPNSPTAPQVKKKNRIKEEATHETSSATPYPYSS